MRKSFAIVLIIIGAILFAIGAFSLRKPSVPVAPVNNVENNTTLPSLPPQAGLPPAVEAKRQEIYRAALSRDYDVLARAATEPFKYSFGMPVEGGFAAYLKTYDPDNKELAFDVIPKLLVLPYGLQGDLYTWPSVFLKASTEWTADDIAQMKTLLTDAEIEGYRQFGGYAYYRLGITADGKWIYYIAGD